MNRKNSSIQMKVFLHCSLWVLFISLMVSLSSGGFLKAEEPEPPAPQAPSVLATSDGDYPGIRVEILELKRTGGNTVTLKFAMINDSDKEFKISCEFRESGAESCGSISGVHLIDNVGKKKYLVVRDSDGNCLCSRGVPEIEFGSRINLWARFPAPPENVEKITVVVPHFIPMDDVSISK